jgi:hypothetical protein
MRSKIVLSIPEDMIPKFKNLISNINKLNDSEDKILVDRIYDDNEGSIVAKPKT